MEVRSLVNATRLIKRLIMNAALAAAPGHVAISVASAVPDPSGAWQGAQPASPEAVHGWTA
jgi:hypothetical protein